MSAPQATTARVMGIVMSGRFDRLTVAQARTVALSDVDLSRTPVTRRMYFGCHGQAGHYFHEPGMRHVWGGEKVSPWGWVDGSLNPKRQTEGEAYLHHKGGWTAVAFADRTVDTRPGSNSVFLFDSRLSFDEALADAREHFPEVFERLTFDIVLVEQPQVLR